MANSPSKAVLVAGAVMGIAAMVILNSMNKTPKSEEQLEQEQQRAQAAEAAKTAPKPIPAPPTGHKPGSNASGGTPGASAAAALVGLGQDKIVGASAKGPEVSIRYSWTPAVQSDPEKVYDAVAAISKAAPGARIHVVNTDENPGAPDGIFVGTQQIAAPAPDGSLSVNPNTVKMVVGAASKKK